MSVGTNPYEELEVLKTSHSSQMTFKSCARKFEFRKLWSKAGESERSIDTEVGHALHVGFQTYLDTNDRMIATAKMCLRYPWDLNADSMHPKSAEACYASLMTMIDKVSLDELQPVLWKDKDGEERAATELGFQMNILNSSLSSERFIPIIFGGFIDAIFYDRYKDEYIVVDIKTTRWKLNDYGPVYQYDTQCIPYAIMLEHLLGRKIKTLSIRYIIVYIDVHNPECHTYTFDKTEEDIQDWATSLYYEITQQKWMFDRQWWPRNSKACVAFGKPCQFLDTCMSRDIETLMYEFHLYNKEVTPRKIKEPDVVFDLDLGIAA